VRMAATVASDDEVEEFRRFLDAHQIGEADRVIRRVALRGSATQGIALARADLLKSPSRRKGSIGILSGPRTPICLSPPKFFRSPSPFPPCTERSNAKASIGADWR
jgi:hypothetical protein